MLLVQKGTDQKRPFCFTNDIEIPQPRERCQGIQSAKNERGVAELMQRIRGRVANLGEPIADALAG